MPPEFWMPERLRIMRDEILPQQDTLIAALFAARERWGEGGSVRSWFADKFKRHFGISPTAYLRGQLPAVVPESDAGKMGASGGVVSIGSEFVDWIKDIAAKPVPACEVARADGGESLMVLVSDLHVGCGREAGASLERLGDLPARVTDIADSRGGRVDEIVVLLIGDIVDGEGIYPGQDVGLYAHAVEQVRLATEALWQLLVALNAIAPTRAVCVRGNHGRTYGAAQSNWDTEVYRQLELISKYSGLVGVVAEADEEYAIVDVRGHRGLIRHRAPIQADTAAARAQYGGWHSIHGWDWMAVGHWHNYGVMTYCGRPIFRNGAGCGWNEYGEHLAKYSPACLLVVGVDANRCPSFVTPVVWP